jgi:hypothetical protein
MGKTPTLTHGSRLCGCGSCLQFFASPSAFELHRPKGKCLTQTKLRRAGWRKNKQGFWTLPREKGERDGISELGSEGL